MIVAPSEGMRFLVETPETHLSTESQAFIRQEIERPSKVWVQEVVQSDRESEFVKLRTDDFVLLPDLNGHRRQARAFRARAQQQAGVQASSWRAGGDGGEWGRGWRVEQHQQQNVVVAGGGPRCQWRPQGERWGAEKRHDRCEERHDRWGALDPNKQHERGEERHDRWGALDPNKQHERGEERHDRWGASDPNKQQQAVDDVAHVAPRYSGAAPARHRFNWLAIVADPSLRSVRDLRGEHIGMLERLYDQCVAAIQREHKGVSAADIMVFANYPPSVYKLHFHFCAPFFQPTAYDAFRMHSLSGIINNLKIHPLYYKLSSLQIPVHSGSELYRAISGPGGGREEEEEEEEEQQQEEKIVVR